MKVPHRKALFRLPTPLPPVCLLATIALAVFSGCISSLTIVAPRPSETVSSTTVTIQLSFTQCDSTTLTVWLNGEDITAHFTISETSAQATGVPVLLGPNLLSATIQATPGSTLQAVNTFYCVLEPERFVTIASPKALAFDQQGYLYVACSRQEGRLPLYRISPDGTQIEPFGQELTLLGGVSVDQDGNVIVGAGGTDAGIYRVAPNGSTEQIVSGSGIFTEVHSLVAVPKVSQLTARIGGLYFAAASMVGGGEALLAIDPTKRLMSVFTNALPPPLRTIALNPDAKLLVLAGNKIYLVDESANATVYLDPQSWSISSFGINNDGLYFATDPSRQQLALITSRATPVPVAYGVSNIQSLAISPNGNMYVADMGADAILRVPFDFNTLKTGTCKLTNPSDPIVANSKGTWRLRYTVGPAGMNVTGGLMIGFRHPIDWGSFQPFFPTKPNYMTSRCSRLGTFVQARPTWLISDVFIKVTLSGSRLEQGDWIEVTLGDTSYGSSGQEAPSIAIEETEWFVFDDIYGKGIYDSIHSIAPERVPRMTVAAEAPYRLSLALKSYADVGQPLSLVIKALDAYGNLAETYTGVVDIYDYDSMVELASAVFGPEDRGVKAVSEISYDSAGVKRLLVRDEARGWEVLSNPVEVSNDPSNRMYWGDLHGHSLLSDALPSPDVYYYRAKVLNQMDFGALSDHLGGRYEVRSLTASVLNENSYAELKTAAAQYNQPGSFVTFVALENSASFGHRNVYYSIDNPSFFEYSANPTTFFQAVRSSAPQGTVMVIGHQHNGIPGESGIIWSTLDPGLDRLVEICSNKGVREYKGNPYFACDTAAMEHGDQQVVTQDALAMGYRLGFVGTSDNHTGWPGGEGAPGKNLCPIFGLTGVRAEALTREVLWQALYNRRTVATTGAKVLLDFHINGQPIGSELAPTPERTLEIEVHATAPIQSLDVVKNNEVIYSLTDPVLDVVDLSLADGQSNAVDYYYVRVIQQDGHIAWSSPIWVGP
jgi:hypothetical protein